ncbi:fatty acid desaturase [Candidatus Uabimicrobium sp. HlEnr_7]|uniref:fatty acid desaturase family protein n=1 Tax=Candidatus Uabimicrobium helgolandensis TaxID=3095367 RepID=UPI003557328C
MPKNNIVQWRKYTNRFAWPTVCLAIFIFCGFCLSFFLVVKYPYLEIWLGIWNVIFFYLAFSVAHEAAHGNIHGGNKKWKWVNTFLGWGFTALFFVPFSVFRRVHLRHHGVTNDPHRDPDYWVAGDKWWKVLFRCSTIFFHYLSNLGGAILREPPKAVCSFSANIIAVFLLGIIITIPYILGFGDIFVTLWLFPVVCATALLAFVFDWLPHHPHQVQQRFMDTRIILFPGLNLVLLGQNYHLIHHLYPKIPFYNYKTCFDEIEEGLREKGAPISKIIAVPN